MSKPTVLFVPGAWHTPEAYGAVMTALEKEGYPTICIPLPSCGAMPPHYDFTEDVHAIREAATKLVEEDREVVIVLHSYTGLPGGEALNGLGRKERQQEGKDGGVIRMVFIMAYAVPEGFQQLPRGETSNFPPWMRVNTEAGIVTVDPEDAKRVFYNDLPTKEADHWASKLQHQSLGVYWSTATYAAWRYIPSTYVLCNDDQAFTKAVGEMFLQGAKQIEPTSFDIVERCDAGHFPFLSQVEWMVKVLRKAAGEKV